MSNLADENMDCLDETEEVITLPSRYILPSSGEAAATLWQQKMYEGLLTPTHFRDYWRVTVPRVYSPEINRSCLEWVFDEDLAQKVLIYPLEYFICGGNDPTEALRKLSQLKPPPSVCGKVFKLGEPAYCCRECGMDSTCVLCVDCFKQSAHRNHKYKMGTSIGGGCCDCGDPEAWKNEPFCDTHKVGSVPLEASRDLPEDVSARTKEVFSAVLGYCYQLLTYCYSPGPPNDLRLKDNEQDPLRILEEPDSYCTVLYNDETHTFEQVITSLTRVIKCTQRDAIEYVTNIDREGRAVIKCSSFQHCNELKAEIERFTSRHGSRSLKVLVVHTHVIAHQIYAMKLLNWLQSFVGHAEGFRFVLSEVALAARPPEAPVAEGILLRDCLLWKAARTAWHRLLIAGMLMDHHTKKSLAVVFTKNYASVIKDFINDDHDHAYSVSSLSVQLYTVRTLAHHLIANEDALFILLNTFLSECRGKCNKFGKLEFERNVANTTFKRAQFVLYDLKYLLSAVPDTWTDALRKGFLQGLSLILNLLTIMQCMDPVSRQVGQHMEFEPEWESGFNLHIKLATVVSLALEWCATDKVVLVKAYRATLKKLYEHPPNTDQEQIFTIVQELADHSATCITYDVASKPVSIHLPLSRFLAGLHLHLHKFGLTFDSPEFNMFKPTPEQMIEPVLRTQAMIAQVHAGMWRRNGYGLLNQLYFYHNVKCRTEMLDRDIVLLQVGASLIESNEFLIHLLNKFNLLTWSQPHFEQISLQSSEEDSMRQTISLVEEFLGLLITVIGERHMPGVGECSSEERIKKEIIQQLCVKPLSHSELNRTLPEDQLHETGMENVIEEIAEFKKPTLGQGRGVYCLKPEFYIEYNVFFYHYTREDISKSEEEQRKRKKTAGELECCPPPELPRLAPAFAMLADLLQCDVMLHIMHTILSRSANLRARSFSEMQLHKVLHLIGMALQEQANGRYPFLLFTDKAQKRGIHTLLEELQKSPRIDAHKDLVTWTLNKFRSVSSMNMENKQSNTEISSSTSLTDEASEAQKIADSKMDKQWRAEMAALKRAKVMAQMQAMQNSFMKEHAELFKETDTGYPSSSNQQDINEETSDSCQSIECVVNSKSYTCILCQEDTCVTIDGQPLVLAGFVQQSTVLLQNRNKLHGATSNAGNVIHESPWLNSVLGPASHVSTCGHVMHGSCWQTHYENVARRENRRPYRTRQPASFDVEKQEFLCPLCECLSNTVLPLLPPLTAINSSQQQSFREESPVTFEQFLSCLNAVLKVKILQSPTHECNERCTELHCHTTDKPSTSPPPQNNCTMYSACHIQQVTKDLGDVGAKFASLFTNFTPQFSHNTKELLQLFAMAMYTRALNVHPYMEDPRVPNVVWSGAAYSLNAVEVVAAASNRPLLGNLSSRHHDCLQTLIRIVGVLGSSCVNPELISSHAIELLSSLLCAQNANEPSLLEWDSFGFLVSLTMSLPGLFITPEKTSPVPFNPVLAHHVRKLLLMNHLVKLMITSNFEDCSLDTHMDVEDDSVHLRIPIAENCSHLLNILKHVRRNIDITNLNDASVWNVLKNGCQSFLRNTCLFYHSLTDVTPLPQLMELGGDTFENMCSYLRLPYTFDGIFATSSEFELASLWSSHTKVIEYLKGENVKLSIVSEPKPPCKLVTLPYDYSDLINTVSMFTCPNSDREDSRNPTMCLVCGEMLCSQSYCCQTELNKNLVGACTHHAHICGSGVGIFLRVRECEVLLLASPSKGCFSSPPYVDQYGETDQGLRRGHPLHLCQDTYRKLEMLWLNHGIHEEIARSMESNSTLMNTTWQHL